MTGENKGGCLIVKLYEAVRRGSYSQGVIRNTGDQEEFNTFSSPPVSNTNRAMPDRYVLEGINYLETEES